MPTAGKSSKKKSAKKTSTKTATKNKKPVAGKKTLAFDIGGSGLKATVLDDRGEMLTERVRVETPQPCPPRVLLEKLKELLVQLPVFDRVSVGFPGVVRHGKTLSCKNLGSDEWNGFDLQKAITKVAGKPT
ncbi:MAG: ROK family protein, partial [Blastocatellia bacterium]